MASISITARIDPRLIGMLNDLGPAWRREILSAGSKALAIEVRRHLRRIAPAYHRWATMLGGQRTGHIQEGYERVTAHSTAQQGVVTIPIAGISRAFGDLTVTAKRAKMLTIPVAGAAYGHRVRELQRLGWRIWRVKHHDILMGRKDGDKEAQTLYALKKSVTVRQDRALLPSDERMRAVIIGAARSAMKYHTGRTR